jgi:hypothetical protein
VTTAESLDQSLFFYFQSGKRNRDLSVFVYFHFALTLDDSVSPFEGLMYALIPNEILEKNIVCDLIM